MYKTLRLIYIFTILTFALPGFTKDQIVKFDCESNKSLNSIIAKANSGTVINIQGNCQGPVYIDKDGITLDGQGTAILEGNHDNNLLQGILIIDQARKITIRNLSVKSGKSHGILVTRNSSVDLINITVEENAQNGIFVMQNSTIHLENALARDNGNYGIAVIQNSSAAIRGNILAINNANSGILLADNAMADVHDSNIHVKGNLNGLQFGDNAVLFTTSTTKIVANENHRDGLFLFNTGILETAGGGYVEAKNNQASGARLLGNATIANPMGVGTFVFEENPEGLHFDLQSSGFFNGGLTVRNNIKGINASGANTLTIISLPNNPSVIQGNQEIDIDLSFGVRADFQGISISNIHCDSTILIRGNVACTH